MSNITFSFGPTKGLDAAEGPDRGFVELTANEKVIAHMVLWAFNSCACGILCSLGNAYGASTSTFFWGSAKNITALVQFLKKATLPKVHNPKEWYVLLSADQMINGAFTAFMEHPNVKKVDSFAKKPYGGTPLGLFRLSLLKDFNAT